MKASAFIPLIVMSLVGATSVLADDEPHGAPSPPVTRTMHTQAQAVADITQGLRGGDRNTQLQALSAVRKTKETLVDNPNVLEEIEKLAESPDETVSVEAVHALYSVGSAHSVDALLNAMRSTNKYKRLFGAAGLLAIPAPRMTDLDTAVDVLTTIIASTPLDGHYGQVTMAAQESLTGLADRAGVTAPHFETFFKGEIAMLDASTITDKWEEYSAFTSAWWASNKSSVLKKLLDETVGGNGVIGGTGSRLDSR